MKNLPLVSVVIPYHKKKFYFNKTINSILGQTYKKFEIILIYDDNNLNELEFLKKIKKKFKKIKLIINKKNLGPGLSRNKGILLSRGTYIAFCDADDIWKKNKLDVQLKFMISNNLDISHTSYYVIDESSKKIGKFKVKPKINYKDLLKSCDIGLSTVLIKKSTLKNFKFSNLKTKEDYYLWLRLSKKNQYIFGLDSFLTLWRDSGESLSSSLIQKISDAYRLYKKLNYNNLVSIVLTFRLSIYALIKKIFIFK